MVANLLPVVAVVAAPPALVVVVLWFLSPGPVPSTLRELPSMLLVYRHLIRSALTPKKPKQGSGAITITVTEPVATNDSKYVKYLRLAHFKQQPAQLPLLYPYVESFRLAMLAMSHPAFPFPVLGAVLARTSVQYSRAVRPGEPLLHSCSVDTAYTQNDKGDFEVIITSTARSSTQEEVWRSQLTMIVINPKRQRAGGSKPTDQPESSSSHLLTTWRVPGDAGRAYGALSGDRNPIHLYPLTAQLFGFKRPIAHALFLTGCLEGHLASAGYTPKFPAALSVEFKRPTLLPATLQAVVLGEAAKAAAAGKQAALPAKGAPLEAAVMTGDGQKPVLTWSLALK